MIAATIPQFFTSDMRRTLSHYKTQLGFETQFEYGDPAHYAGVIRNGRSMFLRYVGQAHPWPDDKYTNELLDAYIIVEDIPALFAEYQARSVTFHRELQAMPWGFSEFVVKDIDGRLLCFGQFTDDIG